MITIEQKLIDYINKRSLKDRVEKTAADFSTIFSPKEAKLLQKINGYDQRIQLMKIISKRTKHSYKDNRMNFWIINEWGQIRLQRNKKNTYKIEEFSNQLIRKKMSKDIFLGISSFSKLASFIDPNNFVIYDSRVVYAMNWLILTTKTDNQRFFPMPSGRSKNIVDFDMRTIIHLANINKYINEEDIYFNHQSAYFNFSDRLKEIATAIFGKNAKSYMAEMLLYSIAKEEISAEVKDKIRITFK